MIETFLIDNEQSYKELYETLQQDYYLKNNNLIDKSKNQLVCLLDFSKEFKIKSELDDIIYGKNKESNIVNISIKDNDVHIFKEFNDRIVKTTVPYKQWVLAKTQLSNEFKRLSGDQQYKWIKDYTLDEYESVRSNLYKVRAYSIAHKAENFMTRNGHTYFKNMKIKDVSLLSFDIETSGLNPNASNARVYLITNTFRKNESTVSRTFCIEDYSGNDAAMIDDWCQWVISLNPSILLGHNIVMFDIKYLNTRYYKHYNKSMPLGREGVEIEIEDRDRELRKDGSQSYTYNRINVFGRDVVDTFFLSIKADISRKYESYGLKSIIKQEGLEEPGRQAYDASLIEKNWHNPDEREKIIAYAEADSRDPIKLFDLMAPTFFYVCPVVPKPFQVIIESATGSQLNAVMVRSYLQLDHSIAEASDVPEFQGAISFGVPGVYKNVMKIDFSALYPSIMREFKVHDHKKDPKLHFNKMVDYFAEYRQQYKRLYKDTGEKFYDDMQNVAKVLANSCYGFLAASGLNYNSPENASFITAKARELLTFSIKWATGKEVDYWQKLFEEKTSG